MACRASTIVLLHCDMRILDKPLYKKEFLSVVRLAFVAVFLDSSSVDAIFPLCLRAKPSGKNYPEACRSARANMADDVVEVPVDEIEAESSLKEQNSDPKGEKRKKETLDALLEEHGWRYRDAASTGCWRARCDIRVWNVEISSQTTCSGFPRVESSTGNSEKI